MKGFLRALPLSIQHVFAMFGSTVLVPYLTGLDPGSALIASGVGTIIFHTITRGKVPTYLGSSFAFIAPLAYYVGKHHEPGQAAAGLILVSVVCGDVFSGGFHWLSTGAQIHSCRGCWTCCIHYRSIAGHNRGQQYGLNALG